MAFCSSHVKELNFKTKTKGVPYHWIEEGKSGFDNICYGGKDEGPQTPQEAEAKPVIPITTETKPAISTDPNKMSKADWEAKEKRSNKTFEVKQQRDMRNSLAISALRELLIHSEGKINHQKTLDSLYYWSWNGTWKTAADEMNEDINESMGETDEPEE